MSHVTIRSPRGQLARANSIFKITNFRAIHLDPQRSESSQVWMEPCIGAQEWQQTSRFGCPEQLFDLGAKGHREYFKKVKLALLILKVPYLAKKTKNKKKIGGLRFAVYMAYEMDGTKVLWPLKK